MYSFLSSKQAEQTDFYSLFQSSFCWHVLSGQSPGAGQHLQAKPKWGGIQSIGIILYFKGDIILKTELCAVYSFNDRDFTQLCITFQLFLT